MISITVESTLYVLFWHSVPFLGFQLWGAGKAEMPGHSDMLGTLHIQFPSEHPLSSPNAGKLPAKLSVLRGCRLWLHSIGIRKSYPGERKEGWGLGE